MSAELNPNGKGALLKAREIKLIRAENGWLVKDANKGADLTFNPQTFFCFESTASLAKHLAAMVGETKWTVCEPSRDSSGKFAKALPEERSDT